MRRGAWTRLRSFADDHRVFTRTDSLAPPEIGCIGIIGAGMQARLQLDYLREVTPCRRVKLWARAIDRARALTVPGFDIEVVASPSAVAADARLIVTTTASRHCGSRFFCGCHSGTAVTAFVQRPRFFPRRTAAFAGAGLTLAGLTAARLAATRLAVTAAGLAATGLAATAAIATDFRAHAAHSSASSRASAGNS